MGVEEEGGGVGEGMDEGVGGGGLEMMIAKVEDSIRFENRTR